MTATLRRSLPLIEYSKVIRSISGTPAVFKISFPALVDLPALALPQSRIGIMTGDKREENETCVIPRSQR